MATRGGVRKNAPRWHSRAKLLESRPWDGDVQGRKNRGSVHALPALGPEGGDHAATPEFYEAHTLDKVSLPAVDGRLDMQRVTSARGDASPLYVLSTFRHLACIQYDAALHLRPVPGAEPCQGDYAKVDMANLEGCLVPWFAPLGKVGGKCTQFFSDERTFSMRPVALATMTDYENDRSGSELVALGFVVSTRAFNRYDATGEDFDVSLNPTPAPDPRPVNPATYCTAHYVLVVKSLDRVSLKMGPSNPLEHVFRWAAWSDGTPPRTGLGDMLMHGGSILRAMLPAPLTEVAALLRGWRDSGELEHHLHNGHGVTRLKLAKQQSKVGLVVRKALLVEHLLKGTPMQYLLDGGEPPPELLDLRVPLPPDGAAGLFACLVEWTSSPASSWFGTV